MAKCIYCDSETSLFVNALPVCPACGDNQGKQQRQSIFRPREAAQLQANKVGSSKPTPSPRETHADVDRRFPHVSRR
jgi:hypothetical protein